jgi:predicted NUDIX family phosphoesterase
MVGNRKGGVGSYRRACLVVGLLDGDLSFGLFIDKPRIDTYDSRASSAPSMSIELQEKVLVVPSEIINSLCPKAFSRNTEGVTAAAVKNAQFLARSTAETDFNFKQIIPYVLVRHENRYVLMRRTTKQTEARLHDKYSIGVGGHINDQDMAKGIENIIHHGMRREIEEEMTIKNEQSCELVGVINDNSSEVSKVHMGLVYILTTGSPDFEIAEKDKYTANWATVEEMLSVYDKMESWTQIVYDNLLRRS